VATAWVRALAARVVVELGVRTGVSTHALLAGAHAADGQVWGVDLADRHGIVDPRFTFIQSDAAEVAGRWETIDLLHIDTDPHSEEQTRRWFDLYAAKCRAIALHDTHHPAFGVGAAVRAFVASGAWRVSEYWGNASGWTVLTRPGEPWPAEEGS
jgi:predicted O-methyltransferase YrrM